MNEEEVNEQQDRTNNNQRTIPNETQPYHSSIEEQQPGPYFVVNITQTPLAIALSLCTELTGRIAQLEEQNQQFFTEIGHLQEQNQHLQHEINHLQDQYISVRDINRALEQISRELIQFERRLDTIEKPQSVESEEEW
jgi:chromosome segregation ATPase